MKFLLGLINLMIIAIGHFILKFPTWVSFYYLLGTLIGSYFGYYVRDSYKKSKCKVKKK